MNIRQARLIAVLTLAALVSTGCGRTKAPSVATPTATPFPSHVSAVIPTDHGPSGLYATADDRHF